MLLLEQPCQRSAVEGPLRVDCVEKLGNDQLGGHFSPASEHIAWLSHSSYLQRFLPDWHKQYLGSVDRLFQQYRSKADVALGPVTVGVKYRGHSLVEERDAVHESAKQPRCNINKPSPPPSLGNGWDPDVRDRAYGASVGPKNNYSFKVPY